MARKTLISTLKGGRAEFFSLLWKRISEQGDFPSLSESVKNITDAMNNEDHSAAELTGAILTDYSLTQKVIRLANSAMYAGFGGEINTITKAALVLGHDAIGHLALSVRFMDTISATTPETAVARAEMSKALLSGDITRKLLAKANVRDSEEAVVCAMMHHTARLLVAFYFPDEWSRILTYAKNRPEEENKASAKIIGLTLDEIAQEVAKHWNMPSGIAKSMSRATDEDGTCIPGSPEWLRMVASLAGEAAAVVADGSDPKAIKRLTSRYADNLLVSENTIVTSVDQAVKNAKESSDLIEYMTKVEVHEEGKPQDAKERLAFGIQDVAKALAEGIAFGDALDMVLETMYTSMGFHRVAAFLRGGGHYRCKVGFGSMMPRVLPDLVFSDTFFPDVFHLSLSNNADVFIEDASSPRSTATQPDWFIKALPDVRAFVLLPLYFNGRPVGLLYGDWSKETLAVIDQVELASLKSLRDKLMTTLIPRK